MGIAKFCIDKVSAQIIYHMLMELLILLNQYHTNRLLRRGHINKKITAIVWWTKHGGRCQGFLQCIKRILGSLIPDKRCFFIQKVHETLIQIGKIDNKPSQEVVNPLQTMKMSNCVQGRQSKYCLNLKRVDPNSLLRNDKPQ